MPRNSPTVRMRRSTAATLAVAATLALALGGCGTRTVAPGSARADEVAEGKGGGGGAKGHAGAVDCEKAKCVALTFDAGPGRDTPRLLDILKKKQVPATFFLLGEKHVVEHPEVVRRIADEGHEVANHTWSHRILTDLKPADIRDELARTQDALAKITGRRPTLMRPPQGRTNGTVADVCRDLGLSQVLWSVTAKDYSTTDSDLIEQRVLADAGADGIILLHDIYDGTVPAVPGIIDKLKKRGFTFVTVPQLLAPAEPTPGTVYRP